MELDLHQIIPTQYQQYKYICGRTIKKARRRIIRTSTPLKKRRISCTEKINAAKALLDLASFDTTATSEIDGPMLSGLMMSSSPNHHQESDTGHLQESDDMEISLLSSTVTTPITSDACTSTDINLEHLQNYDTADIQSSNKMQ